MSDNCRLGDPSCLRNRFTAPIAVGATVTPEIDVAIRGTTGPALHFESANDAVLAADRGALRGKAPGIAALLLVTDSGTVIDFLHVWVKGPTGIQLTALSPTEGRGEPVVEGIDLLPGESMRLSATLHGDGQPLAGDAPQSWTIDKPIAAILRDGAGGRRRIVAVEPGRATLRVEALEEVAQVEVVVHDQKTRTR